ncbi:MAG TPA: DNA translocase FtsK [Gemmatimonadales bacterium]|nr:DNA translocase FtsK [Gemmatimonadales bacterium]
MPTDASPPQRSEPRRKDELRATGALLLGVFLALATLPLTASVTGSVGRSVGAAIREVFGAGSAAVPLISLFWSVALLGHFDRNLSRRITVLLGGLAIAIPFALGVAYQYGEPAVREALAAGIPYDPPHWVGLVGGFLAYYLRFVGPVGEALLAFGAFSALTIATVGWNPLGALRKTEGTQGAEGTEGTEGAESAEGTGSAEAPEKIVRVAQAQSERPEAASAGVSGLKSRLAPKHKPAAAAVVVESAPVPRASADLLPPLDLLDEAQEEAGSFEAELDRIQRLLIDTLRQFKVEAKPGGRTTGPVVTQFEVIPEAGVKVGRIAALADDLALAIKAPSIRIVAPIPGRGAVGVEVPNPQRRAVGLRKLLESAEFRQPGLDLPIALGEDLEGRPIVADLAKMPHLLIAGATGSGKSVCINTIITSLVYHHTTDRLRMLMIDPKMVELSMYKELPHLRHMVVTDNRDAAKVFKWAVWEMQDRYELLHANAARNIADFNRKVESGAELKTQKGEPYSAGRLPYIVVFVDELADLMMTVASEIETPLAMLAQKARAIGIHVVLATQRPSVNVITGLIKANFPSRIAFRVASKVDSRTILDQNGAEALLGYGDMLFLPPGKNDPLRLQGAFISTEETEKLMQWFADQRAARIEAAAAAQREPNILDLVQQRQAAEEGEHEDDEGGSPEERDKLFRQAAEICIQAQGGSTSLLQRRLKIGYGRAARLMDQLESAGVLGPSDGPRGREVLIGLADLERIAPE